MSSVCATNAHGSSVLWHVNQKCVCSMVVGKMAMRWLHAAAVAAAAAQHSAAAQTRIHPQATVTTAQVFRFPAPQSVVG
jgi:hypothetical protein